MSIYNEMQTPIEGIVSIQLKNPEIEFSKGDNKIISRNLFNIDSFPILK